MTWKDDVVSNLRRLWPDVIETSGWRDRGNGATWAHGKPVATMNHHLVVPSTQRYEPISVDMSINGYTGLSGPIDNTMIASDGTIYLIAGEPANHPGKGRRDVLERLLRGLAPLGNAADVYGSGSDDYGTATQFYFGAEMQHPGDSSSWPDVQIRAVYAWNAAVLLAVGRPAESAIHHREHSWRKIDMSWSGDLRAGVRLTMTGQIKPLPTPAELEEAELMGAREDILTAVNAVRADVKALHNRLGAVETRLSNEGRDDAVASEVRRVQLVIDGEVDSLERNLQAIAKKLDVPFTKYVQPAELKMGYVAKKA